MGVLGAVMATPLPTFTTSQLSNTAEAPPKMKSTVPST